MISQPGELPIHTNAMARLQQHVARVGREREIVGLLLVRDRVVVDYVPIRNRSRRALQFQTNRSETVAKIKAAKTAGYDSVILVHSHPTGNTEPSWGDLIGAREKWVRRAYAILNGGRVYFYELSETSQHFRELRPDGTVSDWHRPFGPPPKG